MRKKTALLIANPHSRSGAQPQDAARDVLATAGIVIERLDTKRPKIFRLPSWVLRATRRW